MKKLIAAAVLAIALPASASTASISDQLDRCFQSYKQHGQTKPCVIYTSAGKSVSLSDISISLRKVFKGAKPKSHEGGKVNTVKFMWKGSTLKRVKWISKPLPQGRNEKKRGH